MVLPLFHIKPLKIISLIHVGVHYMLHRIDGGWKQPTKAIPPNSDSQLMRKGHVKSLRSIVQLSDHVKVTTSMSHHDGGLSPQSSMAVACAALICARGFATLIGLRRCATLIGLHDSNDMLNYGGLLVRNVKRYLLLNCKFAFFWERWRLFLAIYGQGAHPVLIFFDDTNATLMRHQ